MRCHCEQRHRAARLTATQAHDVTLGVHLDVLQPGLLQHGHVSPCPRFFTKGRRRNLRELNQLGDKTLEVAVEHADRRTKLRIRHDLPRERVACRSNRLGASRTHGQRREQRNDTKPSRAQTAERVNGSKKHERRELDGTTFSSPRNRI